jgi:hypothetical protein
MKHFLKSILFVLAVAMSANIHAQQFPLTVGKDGLQYKEDAKGNRILDYSYCGYRQSCVPIPDARNVVYVSWKQGDNASRIQRAIDYVASLKPDKHSGLRGAVLLDKGVFEISEPLRIHSTGVILRGTDKNGTVLLKKGVDRGALIYIEGVNDRHITDTLNITSDYVPVGKRSFGMSASLKKGDRILILRPSTDAWIKHVGCDLFGGGDEGGSWAWHKSDADIMWDRTVEGVSGNEITVDVPLTVALDKQWGDCKMMKYTWNGRISDCGVENISLQSDYNTKYPMDEDHCWNGIYMDNAENCWVRMVNFSHFAGSAVVLQEGASQITVEDCKSQNPVSEIGGYRRISFYTFGQECLFQRCTSSEAINDFAAGRQAAGPNAFVQCDSHESKGFSGSISAFAPGLLFDCVNIDGNNITFKNLRLQKHGAGWNTANSLMWQCTASGLECFNMSDDAPNYAYGCWGQFDGDGYWSECNNHVKPWSLFSAQLAQRLGKNVDGQCRVLERNTDASSSPSIDEAKRMSAEAHSPRTTMEMWIDSARFVPSVSPSGCKNIDNLKVANDDKKEVKHTFSIENGKLIVDNMLLVGGKHDTPWWAGSVRKSFLAGATYGLTRFVPEREGRGLTDRVDSVVAQMGRDKAVMFSQNYGLWYDLRRDDHERVRRSDGDVWVPFYEQSFARSGVGTAWDGLSKYDLTRLNPWYIYRLKEFAEKGAQKGMLLFNEHYFQHNILEAGAHWVDCPWRTVNNINDTDFPEPVPFTGDKRVFMADYFYDTTHKVRSALHKQYIWNMLDAFADEPNVIHSIGFEFTGPLHFVEFWLDTVNEWETRNGRHATIALAVNKDVQDSILADKERAKVVDIIDIEQWYYNSKGLYAPQGGVNMAPRQYARKIKRGPVSFADAYRSVSEYRQKYPEKAVFYYAANYPEMAWAVFMAGGSCPGIPVNDHDFLAAAAQMNQSQAENGNYILQNNHGAVVYKNADEATMVTVDAGRYDINKVDSKSGIISPIKRNVPINGSYAIEGKGIYWIVSSRK